MDDLRKKVLAILNKPTPQKFDVLVRNFQKLPINTEDELAACVELVFEKAVTEPALWQEFYSTFNLLTWSYFV